MRKRSLAMLAFLFLVVAPLQAQEAEKETTAAKAAAVTVTTSEVTVQASGQVSGSATTSKIGPSENVTFSGNVVISATVVTDPALPTGVTLFVDGKGLKGVGKETGTVYINSCEANVTRLFRATDKITVTFAFFENKSGSSLKAKTGVLTLNLTYDEASRKLTKATAVVGTLDTAITGTP